MKIETKKIGGGNGLVLIDDSDAHIFKVAWRIAKDGYVVRRVDLGKINGKRMRKNLLLHRVLLGLKTKDSKVADHINRNRLDNRRENLRVITLAQNNQNHSSHKRWNKSGKDSGLKGVAWDARRNKWQASAIAQGKNRFLGYFICPAQAGKVVSDFRKQHQPFCMESL